MRAYLAVPLVKNRDQKKAKLIAKILVNLGIRINNQWILLDNPNSNLSPQEIYQRDIGAIKECDYFVCDISKPSVGIGIELMVAKKFRKKIICIYTRTDISNLIKGMQGIVKIQYTNFEQLSDKLRSKLIT